MADVFISYSQSDREIAEGLADFLGDNGFEVWWDHELTAGENYRQTILERLASVKASIVIWTPNSVRSIWVTDEAEQAQREHKLIATRTESLNYDSIPLGFRGLHTIPVQPFHGILKALANFKVLPSRPPRVSEPDKPKTVANLQAEGLDAGDMIALQHWEFIKERTDPAAFEKFLQDFPKSRLASLAQMQLDKLAAEAWQRLLGSEDTSALEQFVRHYPSHARAAEAKRRLEVLRMGSEEAASFERIANSADIEAVKEHISRFPGGANARAARQRLETLERERDAREHWGAIAGATEPGPFDDFLKTYPDSPYAAQARARRDEIHRAREEADWSAIRNDRHPAPFLRFLKAHPQGEHAAEALQTVTALPQLVDEEAWAEARQSELAIVLQAYLAALPHGRNAKEARARLNALSAGRSPPPIGSPAPRSATGASTDKPKRGRRVAFWIFIGLMLGIAGIFTAVALSSQYSVTDIQTGLTGGAIFLGLAAVMLRLFGPRLYPATSGSYAARARWFHATGAVGTLLWMSLVEAAFGISYENVVPHNLLFALGAFIAAVAAIKYEQRRWLVYGYYGLLLVFGFFGVVDYLSYYPRYSVADVQVNGGMVLLALSCGGMLLEFGAAAVPQPSQRDASVRPGAS